MGAVYTIKRFQEYLIFICTYYFIAWNCHPDFLINWNIFVVFINIFNNYNFIITNPPKTLETQIKSQFLYFSKNIVQSVFLINNCYNLAPNLAILLFIGTCPRPDLRKSPILGKASIRLINPTKFENLITSPGANWRWE